MMSSPPYSNLNGGRCLTYIGTEGRAIKSEAKGSPMRLDFKAIGRLFSLTLPLYTDAVDFGYFVRSS